MSEYRMDIRGELSLKEYRDIHEYIKIVDKEEGFTIMLDDIGKEHINVIMSILKEYDFNISKQGAIKINEYCIKASR